MTLSLEPALTTRTATVIRTPSGFVVEVAGKLHTLKNLLGVDEVFELTGDDAVEFLTHALDKPNLKAVR